MSYISVQEVLDRIEKFHKQLHEYYQALSDESRNERIKLLLDYLSSHEESVEKAIEEYEQDEADNEDIRETWIQYEPEPSLDEIFESGRIHRDMSTDDVIDAVMRVDQGLQDYMEQLARTNTPPRVRDFFNDLLELRKAMQAEYARNIQRVEEM